MTAFKAKQQQEEQKRRYLEELRNRDEQRRNEVLARKRKLEEIERVTLYETENIPILDFFCYIIRFSESSYRIEVYTKSEEGTCLRRETI